MLRLNYKSPIWKDSYANICTEEDSFGYKVTHALTHPEMCIVMDEVGGNISQKGDGHIWGKLLVCGKGIIPQNKNKIQKIKDKHWVLLGITAFNGEPVICDIIFSGIRSQAMAETGMGIFAKQEG